MDEHPDRTLRPAEHARDLGGRQLVHEAQDHRLAALSRQPTQRLPRRPRFVAPDRRGLEVDRIDDDGLADRLDRPAARASALPGDLVAGDLEQPDAESRGALPVRWTGA